MKPSIAICTLLMLAAPLAAQEATFVTDTTTAFDVQLTGSISRGPSGAFVIDGSISSPNWDISYGGFTINEFLADSFVFNDDGTEAFSTLQDPSHPNMLIGLSTPGSSGTEFSFDSGAFGARNILDASGVFPYYPEPGLGGYVAYSVFGALENSSKWTYEINIVGFGLAVAAIPDSGSSAYLMALAVAAMVLVRRRFSAS